MKIKISKEIIEKYPELEIGVIITTNINNTKSSESIQELIKEIEKKIRKEICSEEIIEIPIISKWREIYKSFGAKPSKYRNSIEALLKRIVNEKDLYKINPLVDIYNYISLKYKMTAGGEDIDKMEGDLILGFAEGNEKFIPLGSKKNESPWKGEIVYKDDKGVICRCWNWREGERTKLTEDTKNAVIVIENIIPGEYDKFMEAMKELKKLIQENCDANCEIKILNKDNLEVNLR